MAAGFPSLEVTVAGPHELDVRFELENRSRDPWSADGTAVGWQVFDPATESFLEEGHWAPLGIALSPGARTPVTARISLPPEEGRYRVYVSPRDPELGWHYAAEWPFVMVEATVGAGEVRVHEAGVTTLGRIRRRGWPWKLTSLVTDPARALWTNRRVIASMVRRDLTARYRGSVGDVAWTVLHPLLLMLTYYFVFGIVLQARFGADPSREGFVLYFLAGMLPWLPMSEALGRSPGVYLEHRNFIKKMVFPAEVLPANLAFAGLVTQGFALLIFLGLLFFSRGLPPITIAWLPVLLGPQLLLTLGLGWALSTLGVFLRDLGQMIGFALTLAFFLVPICYPESSLPASAIPLLSLNPVYPLVESYRDILLEQRPPEPSSLVYLYATGVAAFAFGWACYRRLRRWFADVL